jgi:hemolysin activation/secretion protein
MKLSWLLLLYPWILQYGDVCPPLRASEVNAPPAIHWQAQNSSDSQPSNPSEGFSGKIKVEKFEFAGNTAFSAEELNEAVKSFIGQELTFEELLKVEQTITNLYKDAGYINSGAVIPAAQTLQPDGATVTISIVEGGIEDIVITGTERLNPDYVRSRLELATVKPLNKNRLLEALQLLQLNPLIQNISAELSQGVRPDLSLLSVKVTEADSFAVSLFANNGRIPSIGSFQRGLSIYEGNLLGFGDAFEVNYSNTDGSNAIEGRYTIPVNPENGTIRLAGGYNSSAVIDRLFNRLDLTGEYNFWEITYRQPIIQTPTEEFALGLVLYHQESQNFVLGVGYPVSLGADNNGKVNTTVARFFQDYTTRTPNSIFSLRSQFSWGVDAFGATVSNRGFPDGTFFAWRGQSQYVQLLAPNTLLVLRGNVQFSPDWLLAIEQFSVGGLGSVRGYQQDLLLTDNGVFTSVEVRLPVWEVPEVQGLLQLAPFVDIGAGWNNDVPDPSPSILVGVGLGLIWQMGDNLNFRFDYGIPLTTGSDIPPKNSWNANGLYFSLDWRF